MEQTTPQSDKELSALDKKLLYLAKTLSRTKRKDYENYVINRIYNLLDDLDIKPVSQKYVKRDKPDNGSKYVNGYALIDLYFPQFNIGLEVDEAYHEDSNQKQSDIVRAEDLVLALGNYNQQRISIKDKSIAQVNAQIDAVVALLKKEKEKQQKDKTFEPWVIRNPIEYLKGKKEITIYDDVEFHTMKDALNTVLGCDYVSVQKSCFIPSSFRKRGFEKTWIWFPQLSVEGHAAGAHGWNNTFVDNGEKIVEFNEKKGEDPYPLDTEEKRITFMKMKDKITRQDAYKFVGIYSPIEKDNKKGITTYKRISEKQEILPK